MNSKSFQCILNPISIFLLIIWISNDTYWKDMYQNFWTGKLSDLSSLFVFPFLFTFVLSSFNKKSEELIFRISLFFTGVLFSSINLSQEWNDLFTYIVYGNLFGNENVIRGRADLTDLFMLPMLYFARRHFQSTKPKPLSFQKYLLGILILGFSFFAVVNTSCEDCGRPQRNELLLYLLNQPRQKGTLPMNLNPEAPADSSKFLKGDTIEFKWNFQGKETTPSYMEKYPYATSNTEGGKFGGYRIQIFSTPDIRSNSKPIFESADTTGLSLQTKVDISQGTYYWIPVLVFEHGEKKEKRIEILNKKYRTIHLAF